MSSEALYACPNHPDALADSPCTRCGRPFCTDCLIPLRGQPVCAACKHETLLSSFRAYAAPLPGGPAPATPNPVSHAPMQVPPVADSPCALHATRRALTLCERCGDFICDLCVTPFEGRYYCLRCFELLWSRGDLGHRKTKAASNAALALALVGTCLLCLPVVSQVILLVAGVMALRTLLQKDSQAADRKQAGIALCVTGLGLLITTGALAFYLMRGSL